MRIKRLLSLLLAFVLVLGAVSPAVSAATAGKDTVAGSEANKEAESAKTEASPFENDRFVSEIENKDVLNLRENAGYIPKVEETEFNKVDGMWVSAPYEGEKPETNLILNETPASIKELKEASKLYNDEDMVTAFVVMEDEPLAERYRSILNVSWADEEALLKLQNALIALIEKTILKGAELDVRYQFTYLTNAFSIETAFGNLAEIAEMDGVKSVYLMPVYKACTTSAPTATSSGVMTGVPNVWEKLNYRGEGMKIAIVDTGLDLDHPSFAQHDDFVLTENSLTVADIDAVLENLNAHALRGTVTGKTLYRSAKVPYAFNYVDESLTADHSADMQGDHGTHVAGIAAANDNVPGTDVVGMAPEAQLIVMKVFGANGGAYTDDIIAALEDAMTLGCDVANLSLGAPAGFTSENPEIDAVYERIANQDMVVCISAGNEGTSSYDNMWGTNMNTTSNPDVSAVGSPGTYANVTTIASVDNAVVMTPYFSVGEKSVFYMDPYEYMIGMPEIIEWYGNEYEYVIIDGLGAEEDFYDEEGNSLVEGKIAVIRRGDLAFSDKIFNAEWAGAVAAIIWNNSEDDIFTFGMQISPDGESYPGIPACLITVADGQMMADAEEKILTLTDKPGARASAAGGQMSSFSSWGTAPDLTLEPDLAGVGGNVYSCYDGGAYGLMSGTSMSAPQVSGVAALVKQYLKEKFPNASDKELRTMTEALMMSNAEVIISSESGLEASPRQQGAGLVNAAAAVTSEAYLTVNGDKPKATLGDSASGNFSFSFEIHNFGAEDKTYTLDASLLTEAVAGMQLSETEVEYFMYGIETALSGSVSFDKDEVTVPAGKTVTVKVSIALSNEDKAFFEAAYPNGGFVEGYVYLESLDAASLNLPFLGFYGDWTEPPVFDTAFWYDNTFWGAAPANGLPEGNEYYHVMWTNLGGTDWVLGFNPYTGALEDENGNIIYDPANNVVSPNGDGILDSLSEIYLSLMRNAKTLTFTYTNADTGEVLSEEVITNARKTMYQSSYGQIVPWLYSWYGNGLYDFTDANGEFLANNTKVKLTISAKADYADGGNHVIEIPITVDTQGPDMKLDLQYANDGNKLTMLVTDNVALADVFIMNKSGTQMWAEQPEFTELSNGMYLVTIDVSGLGKEFVVICCDYAGNESYFEVNYDHRNAGDNLPEVDTSRLYGYRTFDDHIYSDHMYGWISMVKPTEGEYAALAVHTDDYLEYAAINAAEYVDGKIFAIDAVGNLVMMNPGLWDRTTLCNLGVNALDMTFDDSTDTMYVVVKSDDYAYLCTLDLLSGALTVLHDYGYYNYAPYAIADDDNGTLYAAKYASANLYVLDENYELVAITDAEGNALTFTDSNGSNLYPNYAQSMTYSDGVLYWAYYTESWRGVSSEMICINVADMTTWNNPYVAAAYDATNTLVTYYPMTEIVGLHFLKETDYQLPEAEALESLWMEEEHLILNVGDSAKLKANPIPWNFTVSDLTWTSSDENVAAVDQNGNVTAVSEGNVVITAASGEITVQCVITVVDVTGNFHAYNYYSGDNNYGYMIEVNMATMNYSLLNTAPDFYAADYNGHDGYYYGYTEGGQFWRYDLASGEAVKLGDPIGIVPVDMAYDYSTGLMYAATTDYNTGISAINVVSLTNGRMMTVAELEGIYMMTLACDGDGVLYTVTAWGELYSLNFATGDIMLYADSLGDVQYMQSMCYDHNNDVLLWNYCEAGTILWIDLNNEVPYILSLGDPTGSGLFEFVGMFTVPATISELDDVAVEAVEASDMMMLVGTTKSASVTVMPFNATTQTFALTSSDASVVKANANGTLTAVAEGTAEVTAVLTDAVSGESFTVSFNVNVMEGADDVYGMVLTDLASMAGQYWTRLYTVDTANPDVLESTSYIIYAEEVYNGKLYAYGYDPNDWEGNWQLFIMDPVNHAIEDQIEMAEGFPFVYDMTYDYATSTMYAVAGASDTASDLYVMNMETGELILLMETEQFFMSLAATDKGLYAMEPSQAELDEYGWETGVYYNAMLYAVDPVAKTVELVGDTGIKCNMLSSMAYDYDTGYLYWTPLFQGGSYISSLSVVDTETGLATALGTIGGAGAQVSGLYILSENIPEEAELSLNDLLISTTKASVTAGQTTELSAFVLPLQLDAPITWTTSDASVATVDENGVVTGIAQGKATVTATATYNGVTKTATCQVAVLNADAAFLTYNLTDGGWASISRADMSVVTNLTASEDVPAAAIASVDGTVYGYDVNNTFFTLNTETLARTEIGAVDSEAMITDYLTMMGYDADMIAAELELYAFEVRDMAYDAANDRLLVLGNVYDAEWGEINYGNGIYAVDMTTGKLELLYTFMDIYYVMAMTVTEDGTVIFYNAYNDYYAKLDLNSGLVKNIVSLQTQSVYGDYESDHALYFDDMTGLVYHLFTSNGSFYRMYTVDPVSGALNCVAEGVGEVIYDEDSWSNIGDRFAGLVYAEVTAEPAPEEPEKKDMEVFRIFGDGRCETSVRVADILKETLGVDAFGSIIITNGDEFADALTGSYLAAQKNAPILLYRAAFAENLVAYAQDNLEADGTVYILGGTAAVPASMETLLTDAGLNVVRLYGDNRFDTNLAILAEAGVGDKEILVATGYNFADSLSASATGLPILMVNNAMGLTDNQIEFLESLNGNKLTIIGGEAAISADIENALSAYGTVTRLYGETREETSVKVAEYFFDAPEAVMLAYSRNFPDGLCGGPLAYVMGMPLLLVNTNNEAACEAYVTANEIAKAYVLGGTASVADNTVRKALALSDDCVIPAL